MIDTLVKSINILIFTIVLIAVLISISKSRYLFQSINRKEHQLYLLYPLADLIIRKTALGTYLKAKNNKLNTIKALHITVKAEELQHLFWCSKISLVMVIIIFFNLLSIIARLFGSPDSFLHEGTYLQRPEYGQGSTKAELNVRIASTDEVEHKAEPETKDVTISIGERRYTDSERKAIFQKCFHYLETEMLGENESSNKIFTDLNLTDKVPGYEVIVEWEPEDEKLINQDGTVNNKGLGKQGTDTLITLILSCQEKQEKHPIKVHLIPRVVNAEEELSDKLKEEVSKAANNEPTEHMIRLPDTLNNFHLSWSEKKENSGSTLLFIGIIAVIAAWCLSDRELDLRMKKRKEQLLIDYPELINKFTLLINAGMTMKQAWNRIAEDYMGQEGNASRKKRYAYEEMLITVNELKLGVPEPIAYEQYGRRIGLIPYIKFSSLITQNLKKGTKGFTDLMIREATEAFEGRKETAKRLGEEAGTKLLIPMVVMLIIVFMIIMIPAFLTFRM